MKWKIYGKKPVYQSEWVELWLDDVETPDGRRFDHHVLRFPRPSVTAVVERGEEILLLWRHRFITDAWGWEVPAGWVDAGEDEAAAVAREIEEETGWRAGKVSRLLGYNALSGISTMRFEAFLATDVQEIGAPTDINETERVAWHSISAVRQLLTTGQIADGPSITTLSYYLATRG